MTTLIKKTGAIGAVALMMAMAAMVMVPLGSDESSAISTGSEQSPLTSINCDALDLTQHTQYWVSVGGSITVTEYVEDGITATPTTVSSGFGLIIQNHTLQGTVSRSGSITVNVHINDDVGCQYFDDTITIFAVNPTSFTVSDMSAYVGQNITKTVTTGTITRIDGASWLRFTGGTIYGTAPSAGTYNVTVHAGGSSASFVITVVSALHPTNSPTAGLLTFEI